MSAPRLLAILSAAALHLACAPASPHDRDSGEDEAVVSAGVRGELDEEERAFLEIINAYRVENALEPLGACLSLSVAAEAHSEDMRDRDYFDHASPEGERFPDRACDAG